VGQPEVVFIRLHSLVLQKSELWWAYTHFLPHFLVLLPSLSISGISGPTCYSKHASAGEHLVTSFCLVNVQPEPKAVNWLTVDISTSACYITYTQPSMLAFTHSVINHIYSADKDRHLDSKWTAILTRLFISATVILKQGFDLLPYTVAFYLKLITLIIMARFYLSLLGLSWIIRRAFHNWNNSLYLRAHTRLRYSL
jgi:hypothetical protein